MIRGLYTSALGMTSQMQRMDVISNNIANASTTGYRRDIAVSQSFSPETLFRLPDSGDNLVNLNTLGTISPGVFIDKVYTDFSNGSFINTGSSLDVAIAGSGFFSVEVTDANGNTSQQYTRDGSFTLGADGTLLTTSGSLVLGVNGPIVIPNGNINITNSGRIYSNDVFIDTLNIVNFEDETMLRKAQNNMFTTLEGNNTIPFTGDIKQSFLENSNINIVAEMVEMITTSRAYETNQRLVTIHDTILGQIVSDIARR
jgi:flagellar basal-body rod protein FlgF